MYSYIVTNEQSARLDKNAHRLLHIPFLSLMEEAASRLFYQLIADFKELSRQRIALVAGWGNNGGDVLALARRLYFEGLKPDLYLFEEKTGSELYQIQLETIKKLDLPRYSIDEKTMFDHYDLIIEGIFGTGYKYRENNSIETIFSNINKTGTPIVSVDIPSGLTQDLTPCINAAYTYSIGYYKELFFTINTRSRAGIISNNTISFDITSLDGEVKWKKIQAIPALEAKENHYGHKYTKGSALCIGGSPGKFGSIIFSAESALNTGAGIVTVISDEENIIPLNTMSGRVMTDSYQNLTGCSGKYKAALIGPGLSAENKETASSIKKFCSSEHVRFVLDASFFTFFSSTDLALFKHPPVLTPHLKEFSTFFDINSGEIKKNTLETVGKTAGLFNCFIVFKDCFITIGKPDSSVLVFDHPDAIASQAGSGDILAGIICGLLARGISQEEAIKEALRIFYSIIDRYREKSVKNYIHSDFIKCIGEV